MASQLAEFLEGRKSKAQDVDWQAKREQWVAALLRLNDTITELLQPSIASGVASLVPSWVLVTEDLVGTYSAPELKLTVGGDRVSFTPAGLIVFRADGRVDVKGDFDSIPLIRHTHEGIDDWEFLLQRVPEVVTVPLNEESLVQALQRVMAP